MIRMSTVGISGSLRADSMAGALAGIVLSWIGAAACSARRVASALCYGFRRGLTWTCERAVTDARGPRKSRGNESTFETDLREPEEVARRQAWCEVRIDGPLDAAALAAQPAESVTRHVVLISIDGLRPDAIAAFEEAEREGRGVVTVDGRMVENLHVEQARHTLAVTSAIAALASD